MKVRFFGYPDGTPVAVTITQAGVSASASVDSWNGIATGAEDVVTEPIIEDPAAEPDGPDSVTHEGRITVAIRRSNLGVAPEGFQFEVTGYDGFDTPEPSGVFDARYHDFHFLWDFGDDGASFGLPTRIPAAHRNANVGYGPATAHVYKAPGTYTVSCLVIEPSSGKTALWTQNVTVGDKEALFAGNATIYVDDAGVYAAAPAGAQKVATLAAALDRVSGQTAPHRVMLRRGRTHAMSAGYHFTKKTWRNVWIEAEPGAGAKPVLYHTGSGEMFRCYMPLRAAGVGTLDMVWLNVDFQGRWDSTTESGTPENCFRMVDADYENRPADQLPPDYSLWQGSTFSGFSINIYGERNGVQFLSDSRITNWQDYGYFSDCGRLSILGSQIEQHVNALSGGGKSDATKHNNHGPVRFHHSEQLVIDGSEFFSRNGWFPNVSPYVTEQPCIRFAMSARENDRMNLQRSLLEGGYDQIAVAHMNVDSAIADVNVRIESCLMIGSHMTNRFVGAQFGGITVRNTMAVSPDVKRLNGIFDPGSFLALRNSGISTGSELARILVEFNTVVNLLSPAKAAKGASIGSVVSDKNRVPTRSVVERHNLVHQPNLNPPQTPYAPLHAQVIAPPLHKGYWTQLVPFNANSATPADAVALYAPEIGSPALGAVTEMLVQDDFFHRERPPYPSIGAQEASS